MLALLAMAAVQMSGAIKIVAMSDIHAMSEMLVEKSGAAIDKYAASDMRMIKESAEILRTVIGKIIEQRPDIVMISGDLTKDGERLSHEFVASQLERLRAKGIKVLVIPGNHDISNANAKYFNGKGLKLKITAAFDVDPEKVGKTIDGIPCYHMDSFEEVVEDKDISIVIVSSPTKVAPNLVLPIINAGIRGVLNFTSTPLNFPQGIIVENYDITTLLEKVAYFVKESDGSNS